MYTFRSIVGSSRQPALVVLYCVGTSPTNRHFARQSNGHYKITAAHSGKSLDVASCFTANGADANVRTYTGTDCQRWRIETTP